MQGVGGRSRFSAPESYAFGTASPNGHAARSPLACALRLRDRMTAGTSLPSPCVACVAKWI
ncbi:hypothetical protein [Scytonema sp. HK-05]|uniref:hypothetical protein n=1 Tax=Scytonema sp. HK-05 TaxID=1137095 RepID=UPI000A5E6E24|nr:hypothetical protein [Scytonema sp. HK-05]